MSYFQYYALVAGCLCDSERSLDFWFKSWLEDKDQMDALQRSDIELAKSINTTVNQKRT